MAKAKEEWRRLLEVSVALEIAKTERDAYRDRYEDLRVQLTAATARAEKAEERLQETTRMLFDLGRDAVVARPQSSATEVMVEGRSVLRLSRPLGHDSYPAQAWPQS
jgi:division protein CdvB (Snf7/Vps24/ESCRT-III family)